MTDPARVTNINPDEAPIAQSNQLVDKEGSNYYYEEATVPITFYLSQSTGNANTQQVYFVKRGRLVTMCMPAIRNGNDGVAASIIQSNQGSVPERFRPATDQSGTAPYNQIRFPVLTRSEATAEGSNDQVGMCKVYTNGSIEYFYRPEGSSIPDNGQFPQGVGSTASANVYNHSVSWLTPSSYNKYSTI